MKIKEKKDRPDPIIRKVFQPVALPAIGSAIAKLNAEFSGISRLGSESMRLEMESIGAIGEHFERLLLDERLLKRPRNHRAIKKIYGELMDQFVGELDALLASEKAKRIAEKGGAAKAKKMKEQEDVVKAYYLAHKDDYKNKDDAAFGIEGKKINNIQITVSVSTIRRYLRGL